jgi:Fur family iron response transcriptional regulator
VLRDQTIEVLRRSGIQPSAQRVAVGEYVLWTEAHPSADQVFAAVRKSFPMLSRATVYNTLNLFVDKGILRGLVLAEGRVVFDPHVAKHHHFIDDVTGEIHDLPWEALRVDKVDELPGLEVREIQVILRGRRTRAGRSTRRR